MLDIANSESPQISIFESLPLSAHNFTVYTFTKNLKFRFNIISLKDNCCPCCFIVKSVKTLTKSLYLFTV